MYLLKRNDTYYFRTRVPQHKVAEFGKQEVCVSLHTKDKRQAQYLANKLKHDVKSYGLTVFTKDASGSPIKAELDISKPEERELAEKIFGVRGEAQTSGHTFGELTAAYLTVKTTEGRTESVKSLARTFELFREAFGELAFSELTQGKLGEFKRFLDAYTKRGGGSLSSKTISEHLKNLVALSLWASANYDGIKALTSRGVAPKRSVSSDEERDAFTIEDIQQLLTFETLKPEQLWLIRMAALSGARISEIVQLDMANDIKVSESGTHYLNVVDGDEQRVKTAAGKRQVPIHPQLIELGLLEWFEEQRSMGLTRPFESEWSCYQGSWGKYPSKWFGAYRKRVFADKYTPEQLKKKVFHSFRHSIAHAFKKAGVAEQFAAAFLGHQNANITFGRYAKGLTADDIRSLLDHIPRLPEPY